MQTVIIMIHLMVVLALIGTVLLQRSEGGGLGSGSTGASFMSSRGTANMLTRTTAILAAAFFATSLLLSVMAGMGRKPTSIFQGHDDASARRSVAGSAAGAAGWRSPRYAQGRRSRSGSGRWSRAAVGSAGSAITLTRGVA